MYRFGCKVIKYKPNYQIILQKVAKKFLRCDFAARVCICMYVRTRACTSVKNTRKKNFEKSRENIWWFGIKVITLQHQTTNLKT